MDTVELLGEDTQASFAGFRRHSGSNEVVDCGTCGEAVDGGCICCSRCSGWVHGNSICSGLPEDLVGALVRYGDGGGMLFVCTECRVGNVAGGGGVGEDRGQLFSQLFESGKGLVKIVKQLERWIGRPVAPPVNVGAPAPRGDSENDPR